MIKMKHIKKTDEFFLNEGVNINVEGIAYDIISKVTDKHNLKDLKDIIESQINLSTKNNKTLNEKISDNTIKSIISICEKIIKTVKDI